MWDERHVEVCRKLILHTHRWIASRILGPEAMPGAPLPAALRPGGPLATALTALVPPIEGPRWSVWIDVALSELERALFRPQAERTEVWARWLFLIPYSLPAWAPGGPPRLARRPLPSRLVTAPGERPRRQ